MRLIALFTCILTAGLWGQAGYADIYVWTDENDVKHFTNQNPHPDAEILMRTKEIPYDEAADRVRWEDEMRRELLQAQAEIHDRAARLAEKQAEVQQRIAEADRMVEEAQKRAEKLLESANDRYDSDRRHSDSYTYYPKSLKSRHYPYSKYYYRGHGGIYYQKPHKFHNGHHRFKRHRFRKSHHFRKRFTLPKVRHGGTHKKINTGRYHFRKRQFKSGGLVRFWRHGSGQVRFRGHHRGGFEKR